MTDSEQPITQDSEICKVLTCLPEKFIVDFANGIDVTRDHLRVQQERTGTFARLYDGFAGQSSRRQVEINANLAAGVEGAITLLTELAESLTISNYAIARLSERMNVITKNVTSLAHYSADTRQQLQILSTALHQRCDDLSQEIGHIGFIQRVHHQLEHVFSKWDAGYFNSFSRAGRCYAALEELRWGSFGDYCRAHNNQYRKEFLDILTNRAISQINKDALITEDRPNIEFWINMPSGRALLPDAALALAYLGDWSKPDSHPFVHSITQLPEQIPLKLPKLCDAKRLARALVSEVFEEQYQ